MAGEWREARLGQLGEVNRGHSRHRPRDAAHLYGGAYPFIQTGDIKASGGRITSHCQTYNEAGLAQSRLWPEGTMVITIAANIAETAILTYPACFPDSVVGFIADKHQGDARFIEYLFRQLRRQIQHENVGTGSVQDNINLQTLARLTLKVPEPPEQRRIAHILGTLDDKIENNRKTAKTLEAMAQAIFQSWFVDFDPVRAKMAGESRESICKRLKITPEILDLFPDRLVDSELGEIPEGWGVGPLGNMFGFQNGYAFKSKDWQKYGVPVIKIGSVKPGLVDLLSVSYVAEDVADRAKEYQLQPADLVIGMTGYVGEVGLVPKVSICPLLNQRVGRFILNGRGTQHVSYAYCLMRRSTFKDEVTTKAHGTAQANVSSSAIMSINTLTPTEILRSAFDRLCGIIFDELLTVHHTAMILSNLRDTLLPKLISGEIRIPEAEHFHESVTR